MRKLAVAVMVVVGLTFFASDAFAQIDFGVRAGLYTDVSEPFVGVEAITPITGSWFFNPNVEWVFIEGGDLFTINGDVHYDFATGSRNLIWAGGGLALAWENQDDNSETDLGFNVIGGIGRRIETLLPYLQVKYTRIDEGDDLVLAAGVRF